MSAPGGTIGAADQRDVGVVGWRCAVCSAVVDIERALVFRCPNWTQADPHHSLHLVQHDATVRRVADESNPFIAFQPFFAWDAFAATNGMSNDERSALVRDTDARVAAIDGVGFVVTPFERADALSHALGFTDDGGIWIKDETGNVAGSHKARHLMTTVLHLLASESLGLTPWHARVADRPVLAIASCGNAALAAATLAAAVDWPIHVFVPPHADPWMVARLGELGATVTTCPRRVNDGLGDPCVLRYREAVAGGALPFAVQGPENAWCLDGGRTIGWEMAGARPDHLFAQVGGGALARCAIGGLHQAGVLPRLHAVQTEGCAPLARAWKRALAGDGGIASAAQRWAECMTPWETEPHSAATGILDDETYDWLGIVNAMSASHGAPVIAREDEVLRAHELMGEHTGISATHTGTAGLAGLLAIRDVISNHERVAIIASGVAR